MHSFIILHTFNTTYNCFNGFPGGSDSKESACNVGDPGLIPRSGRSPEKGMVHSIILIYCHIIFLYNATLILTHSSILA